MMGNGLNRPLVNPKTWNFRLRLTFNKEGGDKKAEDGFSVKKSQIRPFYLSDKMGSASIATKNVWNFSHRKMGRAQF